MAQILYPELKGKEFSLQFSEGSGGILSGPTDARSLLLTVDKPEWHPPGEASGPPHGTQRSQNGYFEMELPLYLEFSFADSIIGTTGSVVGTEVSCQPVKFINNKASKQIHKAAEVINAHPEWTDEQDLEAASKLGMRLGPDKKADLLKTLPLRGLSSIYGPLEITEAHFQSAGPKEPGAYFTDLHWYITAKHTGSSKRLLIVVEPFNGKITSLSD